MDLIWLVPVLPLAGAAINLFAGGRLGRRSGWLASLVVAAAFAVSVVVLVDLLGLPAEERSHVVTLYEWIASGSFAVSVDLLVDPLSMTMVLVVTGVGALIHIYAIGYMEHDPRVGRFFAYLNLFVAFMLVLVLADNFLLLYLGWEGVGLCSYLLIGFWYERTAASNAAKKAFITTRVGDVLLMLGILLIWVHFGTLSFAVVLGQAGELTKAAATAVALLLLGGAIGKSAQFPLHVWLPDAMEGPTPVSALIHAATMVTAGVYLVVRTHALFEASGIAMTVVLVIGLISAVYAGLASIGQYDIKRALAYSTMSQIGFMFLAAGMGFYAGAMLLLVSHAFYKALLFLSAGNVMHGLDGEADLRRMGDLRREMPATAALFSIGALALAGVPPLAGFFAKDHIVGFAATSGRGSTYLIASAGAFLSAFYIARPTMMAFFGKKRHEGHAHEAPAGMLAPLVVLAFGAIFAGGLGLTPEGGLVARFLEPVVGPVATGAAGPPESVMTAIAVAIALVAFGLAWWIWASGRVDWEGFPRRAPLLEAWLARAFFVNDLYAWLVQHPGKGAARVVTWFDENVVDGAVNGVGGGVRDASRLAPVWENGLVRSYALAFLGGAAVLLAYLGMRF